jgi:hypothetical protein
MPKMMPCEVIIAMAVELKLDGQNAETMKNQRMMFCFETNSAHPFATAAGLGCVPLGLSARYHIVERWGSGSINF